MNKGGILGEVISERIMCLNSYEFPNHSKNKTESIPQPHFVIYLHVYIGRWMLEMASAFLKDAVELYFYHFLCKFCSALASPHSVPFTNPAISCYNLLLLS